MSLTLICEIVPALWADGAAAPLVCLSEGGDSEISGTGRAEGAT